MSHLSSIYRRLLALLDKSALILILPALAGLFFIDRAMFSTLLEWLVFAPVLAGVAVIVSRIVFHRIDLTKLIIETEKGNVAAGILASAVLVFVALIFAALVTWAKA